MTSIRTSPIAPGFATSETGKANLPPEGAASGTRANSPGGLQEKPETTLREDIEDAADRLALIKSRARREDAPAPMLAHLTIAEIRIATALGELEPRTPERFCDTQRTGAAA